MKNITLKRTLLTAMLSCIAGFAFAEEAPVYDVDNFPPQFDGQFESSTPHANKSAPIPVATADNSGASADQQPAMPVTDNLSLPQRISRLEQQMNNQQRSDSNAKLEDMQATVQTLRGQVDELTHQIQTLQTQQKKMYSDLDKRVSQKSQVSATPSPDAAEEPADTVAADTPSAAPADTIKSKKKSHVTAVTASAATAAPAASQPNDAEEQKLYQSAYNLIKAKKYNDAAIAFESMLHKYPSGQFAANAHYWLGELYGLMGKNDQAVTEFTTVVKTYPDSPKLADAQLKLGLIYAAQFKWIDAKGSFKKVMTNYPGTASSRLASEQLKQIKVAGH